MTIGRRWRRSQDGNVVLALGLAAPVMLGLVGAAVDYSTWVNRSTKLQKAADAAAMAAAADLGVTSGTTARATGVAQAVVDAHLEDAEMAGLVVEASVDVASASATVLLRQERQAGLSRIVSGGSGMLEVRATAGRTGRQKLCVLALDPARSGSVMLDASARLTGIDCTLYVNSTDPKAFASKSAAVAKAPKMCSAGGYEGGAGNFSGDRLTDCPVIPDPLISRVAPVPGPCTSATKLVVNADRTLLPGTYCEGIEIKSGARVTLAAGTYVVKDGGLKVDDNSSLYGRDVSIYFTGTNANFDFLSSAIIDLGAARSGPMAGILFFGDRAAPDTREFKITSNYARTLIGTIYLPRGYLTVDAVNTVADQSAYTAIVLQRLELKQAPNLVLNSNYEATDVPVPAGIRPTDDVRLIR
jgi:hypothetical protein